MSRVENILPQLGKRTIKALGYAANHSSRMYAGCYWDEAPAQLRRLERMGLVYDNPPHNPIHKSRCVPTDLGWEVVEALKLKKMRES